MTARNTIDRLLVELVRLDEATGCWLYTGTTHKGYARVKVEGQRVMLHRALYERVVGPVPDGLELDHLCRVRNCVNPDHLEPVTHAENMARGAWAMRTHCRRGHELTAQNTRRHLGRKERVCHECAQERSRAYRARQKAQKQEAA